MSKLRVDELESISTGKSILVDEIDSGVRADLADPDKGAAMVGRGVVAVDSIADLLALPESARRGDLRYLVKGYHAGSDVGGGEFYWDATRIAENNGGTVFNGFVRVIQDGIIRASFWGAGNDPDGDDTEACMQMVSAVEDDTTLVLDTMLYPDGQTDWPEIVAKRNVKLKGKNGGGVTVNKVHSATGWKSFTFTDCENITISSVTGLGGRDKNTATGGEWGMGIRFLSCRTVTLQNTHFHEYWGDGFYFGVAKASSAPGYGLDSQRDPNINITMINCTGSRNRRQGMSIVAMVGGRFWSCKFTNTQGTSPQAGVDLEPNDAREYIRDLLFFGCEFSGNAGGGLITAGPLDLSRDIYVVQCSFVENSYGLASGITNTCIYDSHADGSTNSSNWVGGFTIRHGKLINCDAINFYRCGFGISGSDVDVLIDGCSTNKGMVEYGDHGIYIRTTGGKVCIRNCPDLHSRLSVIRADPSSTLDFLEIDDVGLYRHFDGESFGATYPVRINDLAVEKKALLRGIKVYAVEGANTNGIVFILNEDTDYLLEDCDVSGWSRTNTNWYSQAVGLGSIDFGRGNTLPSGRFAKLNNWQSLNGTINLTPYCLWVDSSGRLRIKNGAPTSDTDGTIVGAQS